MPGISKPTFRRISLVTKFQEKKPRNEAAGRHKTPRAVYQDRWFVTTSPMTTAVKVGTSLSTYKMTPGSAKARVCLWDVANKCYTPDVSQGAADVDIYNCTVISQPIDPGKFFKCAPVNGVWQADLSSEC